MNKTKKETKKVTKPKKPKSPESNKTVKPKKISSHKKTSPAKAAQKLDNKTSNVVILFAVIAGICFMGNFASPPEEEKPYSVATQSTGADEFLAKQTYETQVCEKNNEGNSHYIFLELEGSENLLRFKADDSLYEKLDIGDGITLTMKIYRDDSNYEKTVWSYKGAELSGVCFVSR